MHKTFSPIIFYRYVLPIPNQRRVLEASALTLHSFARLVPIAMTTLACRCGKVCLTLAAARPTCAVECCCCDCQSTVWWCQQGEGDGSSDTKNATVHQPTDTTHRPATLYYFDNDITNVKGEDLLQLFKLRNDSATLRLSTKCCHSILVNVHWLYLKRRFAVIQDCCKLTYQGDTLLPYARIQTKFYSSEEKLPSLRSGGESYKCDDLLWVVNSQLLQKAVLAPLPDQGPQGESIHDVIARIQQRDGADEIILGMEERELPGHFRFGFGMFSLTLKNPLLKNEETTSARQTAVEG